MSINFESFVPSTWVSFGPVREIFAQKGKNNKFSTSLELSTNVWSQNIGSNTSVRLTAHFKYFATVPSWQHRPNFPKFGPKLPQYVFIKLIIILFFEIKRSDIK